MSRNIIKDFIVDLSMVNSAEDYKNLLCRDGKYSESVELTSSAICFSYYLFKVHSGNSTNTIDYGIKSLFVVCCFQAIIMQGILMYYRTFHIL